jgi:glycerophosphoryl diester phosphodiesterase
VLAHRGGAGPWHENSAAAFAAALRSGADGVELDVRRSVDGELVVHHDAEVPGSGLIHEHRRDELPDWVPTLPEALALCAGAVVNVEIKNVPGDPGYDETNRVSVDVATVLAARAARAARTDTADTADPPGSGSPWPAHVLVSSFWPDTLAAVGAAGQGSGAVPLGLLVHPALDASSLLEAAAALGCAALHPHHSQVSAEFVHRAHTLDLAVFTWTVNGPGDLDAVVEAGVDGLITDDVVSALAHLGRADAAH